MVVVKKSTSALVRITREFFLVSALLQGWNLAKEGYKNHGENYRKKQQWKIAFHSMLSPAFAVTWFETLKSSAFDAVSGPRSRLYIKPFRTYISIKWNKQRKLKVIFDTYRFMKLKGDMFSKLLNENESSTLTQVVLNEECSGSLVLGYDDQFRKEGEVLLSFECAEFGGRVVSVAFSFEEIETNKWVCLVGCVQGHPLNEVGATKKVQKLMHGIRPNSFIMNSLQELCRNLGCHAIYCVGDSIQSYRKKHAIHLPWRHGIDFDYDEFWREVGAKECGKGWFDLPLIATRREMSELKTKKRSMYRKRYLMLDELSVNISAAIH